MEWVDDQIADLERQIATHRQAVDQLRSRKLAVHESVGRNPMQNVSPEAIKMHGEAIQQLQKLLTFYKDTRDKA